MGCAKTDAAVRSELLKLKTLAILPEAGRRVLSLFEIENVSIDMVAQEIERHPDLCARIVGIANSAFFGMSGRVHSASEAMIVIGTTLAKQLALAIVLARGLDTRTCAAFDVRRYWERALMTAMAVRLLSRHIQVGDHGRMDGAYLCGLLHDIGLPILVHAFPVEMHAALTGVGSDRDVNLHLAEQHAVGIDHYEAGAWVMRRWKLPEQVVAVVGRYADCNYRSDHWEMCCLVRICVEWSCSIMAGNEEPRIDDPEIAMLGITVENAEKTWHACLAKRESIAHFSSIIGSE